MPTHEPELSEPYYYGDWVEVGTGGGLWGVVEYRYTEDDGYSYDPDAPGEVEWLAEQVASGPDVNWSDDAEKRKLGEAILGHYFDRAPTGEEIDTFMHYIAPSLEDGLPARVGVNELSDAGLDR